MDKSILRRIEALESKIPSELYVKIFKDEEEKIVSAKEYYYKYLPEGWEWGEGVRSGTKISDMGYLLDGMFIQTCMQNGMSYEEAVESVKNTAEGSLVECEQKRKKHE